MYFYTYYEFMIYICDMSEEYFDLGDAIKSLYFAPAFLVSNNVYKTLDTDAPHFHIHLHPHTTLILKLPKYPVHYNILVRYSHMHPEPPEAIRSSTAQLVVFSKILLLPLVACKPWIM